MPALVCVFISRTRISKSGCFFISLWKNRGSRYGAMVGKTARTKGSFQRLFFFVYNIFNKGSLIKNFTRLLNYLLPVGVTLTGCRLLSNSLAPSSSSKDHHAQSWLCYVAMFGRFGAKWLVYLLQVCIPIVEYSSVCDLIDFIYAKIEIISLTSAVLMIIFVIQKRKGKTI